MLHPKSSRLALLICQMKFFVTLFVTFDTLTETFFARLINSLQDFLYFMKWPPNLGNISNMRENFEVFGMLTKDFKARCHVSIDVIMLAVKDAKT